MRNQVKTGIELIAEERTRQIESEGWTTEHDDSHADKQLAQAAACYATPANDRSYYYLTSARRRVPSLWPWNVSFWKPTPDDRVRELVKAGALIAAEIDRLQRLTAKGL
jgi:hypothetical protein